mmetsp:Transcript_56941/g.133579  ORF Transcript_56941/g.133579 Transcript_56941/m.133579 type:complete len:89 (-) Transcript_56941:838-1104(-)
MKSQTSDVRVELGSFPSPTFQALRAASSSSQSTRLLAELVASLSLLNVLLKAYIVMAKSVQKAPSRVLRLGRASKKRNPPRRTVTVLS